MTISVSQVANNQTFGAWLTTTNRLANLVSQNVVTADSSNGGSVTTGNTFIDGHFGANFVYVANTLSGGNVSSNGVLTLLANVAITNGTSNLVTVNSNSTVLDIQITTNTITLSATGNVNISGNTMVVNTANVLFTGANIQFANSPLSGNITFTSNTVYTGGAIIANGALGSSGAVLYSNGTGMYWSAIPSNNGIISNSTGIFVRANNGIVANASGVFVNANNGIVANATGVFVSQGTGTVVNSTGVHVNSTYIATLAANSATGSSSNTFTVGTASYFIANGNLGIGNSAPAHKLRVEGVISLSSGIHANGSLGANGNVLYSNGTGVYWSSVASIVANTGIISNASGIFVNSAYIATIASNSATFANSSATNTFTVGTASYFIANGNLGIGNSAPAHKLRVEGNISLSGGIHANGSLGSASQALFSNGAGTYWANVVGGAVLSANNTDTQTFYFPMANTTTGTWSNGVVSNTKMYFVPSTGTLNATIFNSLSDAEEKTNIIEIVDGLSKILALTGVEFDWKDNGQKSAGIIAQNAEVVLPHLITTNEAGVKSVNYNGIIAYLISAIHQLDKKIEELKSG